MLSTCRKCREKKSSQNDIAVENEIEQIIIDVNCDVDVSDYDDVYDKTYDEDNVSVYYLDKDIDWMSRGQFHQKSS